MADSSSRAKSNCRFFSMSTSRLLMLTHSAHFRFMITDNQNLDFKIPPSSSSALSRLETVALLRSDHDWRHASRDQRAEGCCPAESGQPICCENGLGDDSIGYLVDVRVIGWHGSQVVPCELEVLLQHDNMTGESCSDSWLTLRLTADQWTQLSRHSKWTGAIWFAVAASDISYGMPWRLWNQHWEESRFWQHTVI